LAYAGLTDDEVGALQEFFAATEGTLNSFTFLDPTGNLLAWSDKLDNAAWAKDPFFSIAGGIADPAGGTNAWHSRFRRRRSEHLPDVVRAGRVCVLPQRIRAVAATHHRDPDARKQSRRSNPANKLEPDRFDSQRRRPGGINRLCLELPAGGSADVFGMQVEPQGGASLYKATTTGGVYEDARFRDERLSITTTGVNRHSAMVNIIYATISD